ncbi:hypothetical protein C0J52_11547 [Blattella germanica]|nr:hypothetical protein C0J52_11547 [Blattella germanica]
MLRIRVKCLHFPISKSCNYNNIIFNPRTHTGCRRTQRTFLNRLISENSVHTFLIFTVYSFHVTRSLPLASEHSLPFVFQVADS